MCTAQLSFGIGYKRPWEILRRVLVCLKEKICWNFFGMVYLQVYEILLVLPLGLAWRQRLGFLETQNQNKWSLLMRSLKLKTAVKLAQVRLQVCAMQNQYDLPFPNFDYVAIISDDPMWVPLPLG
jgi:hypothetical protein